ncbi:MAG: hypothetical protein R2873_09850 [Caldilineaceae bacterium]
MGKGYTFRFSLRFVRLLLASALLATSLAFAGVTIDQGAISLAPSAVLAAEPGGSTGGG